MPLINFWKTNPGEVLGLNLEAIVRLAGDGQLKDGSDCSQEFRQFIVEVESEKLADYANHCLTNSFTNSGQVLQDIVNEIGRRLGFEVENGRYHGVRNDIGFDGIWRHNDEALIVEVKTTDAYTIKLDVVTRYRERLIEAGKVLKETPILLVIGRNETESLEAQVRGSKHAWSMRIVGIDALVKLMKINLSSLSEKVTEKIHAILHPFEYTRVDSIVDVVFTATEDKENDLSPPEDVDLSEQATGTKRTTSLERTPQQLIDVKKADSIRRFSSKVGVAIQKRRHSMYSDPKDDVHGVVAMSKRYEKGGVFYWYAFHKEPQKAFLSHAKAGFMIFGMADKDLAFAVPIDLLDRNWDKMLSTVRDSGAEYKHIYIREVAEKYLWRVREVGSEIDLTEYRI